MVGLLLNRANSRINQEAADLLELVPDHHALDVGFGGGVAGRSRAVSHLRSRFPARPSESHDPEAARRYWEEQAPRYDRLIAFFERVLFADGRRWACSRARGDVLEIAAGTGRNLPYYPVGVQLVITDFSEPMLDIARARATELDRAADFQLADAGALDFPDERFDTVLCTLGLCSVPDDGRAVREMVRVLRPGGRLVLLEHVRSPRPAVRVAQRVLDVPSARFCCDHLTREPLDHVREHGLEVEELERSKIGIVERLLASKRA